MSIFESYEILFVPVKMNESKLYDGVERKTLNRDVYPNLTSQ